MRRAMSLACAGLLVTACAGQELRPVVAPGAARVPPRTTTGEARPKAEPVTAERSLDLSTRPTPGGAVASASPEGAKPPLGFFPPLPEALRANTDLPGLMLAGEAPLGMPATLQGTNLSGLDTQPPLPGTPLLNLDGGTLKVLEGNGLLNLDGGTAVARPGAFRLAAPAAPARPLAELRYLPGLGGKCVAPFSADGRPPLARELALVSLHGTVLRVGLALFGRLGWNKWLVELPFEPFGIRGVARVRFAPKDEGGTLYAWFRGQDAERFEHFLTVAFDSGRKGRYWAHVGLPVLGLVVTRGTFDLDADTSVIETASFPDREGPQLFGAPSMLAFWHLRQALEIRRHTPPLADGTVLTYRSALATRVALPALKCLQSRRLTLGRFGPDQRGVLASRRFTGDAAGEGFAVAGDGLATRATPDAGWYLGRDGQPLPEEKVDAALRAVRFDAEEFAEDLVPNPEAERAEEVQARFYVPPPPPEAGPS